MSVSGSPARRPAVVAAAAVALAVPPVAAFAYVGHTVHPATVTATLPAARTDAEALPDRSGSGGSGSGLDGSAAPSDGSQTTPYGGRQGRPYGQGRGSTSGTAVNSAPGVLLIDGTVPGLGSSDGGTSAGTGMVLSADGYALTNYHVVRGTSALKVTVADTGKAYRATVVGADQTHDVALLRLSDAQDLTPVTIDRDDVTIGQAVTAVGNGGGRDKLYQVTGTVEQLDDDIRVSADETSPAHTLTGLIRTNAAVVPGYSGGPLFDAQGEVMGINTAASSGGAPEGFAVPIQQAVSIADQIKAGKTNGTVRVGPKAVLGVQVGPSNRAGTSNLPGRDRDSAPQGDGTSGASGASGAVVQAVTDSSAAAAAGITEGSTITAVDGTPVADGAALQAAIVAHAVGDEVRVSWTDAGGASHAATAKLQASPIN